MTQRAVVHRLVSLAQKCCLFVRVSGQLKIAQQFTAGWEAQPESQSVKRTTDKQWRTEGFSAVRFTDFSVSRTSVPSDESLGYFQPSAERGLFGQSSFRNMSWVEAAVALATIEPNSRVANATHVNHAFLPGLERPG
jgi:hypothetical protein